MESRNYFWIFELLSHAMFALCRFEFVWEGNNGIILIVYRLHLLKQLSGINTGTWNSTK